MAAESSKMGSARPTGARKKRKLDIKDDENPQQIEAQIRKTQRKGNAGKLAGLVGLPLDVLFEVGHSMFGFIGSSDLSMSDIWSAKTFRPPQASTNDERVQTSFDAQISYICVEIDPFPSPWVAGVPSWHERT
jgi:hypothetical protein